MTAAPRFTVLGASGFIGVHLVTALRRAGHAVFAPERNDPAVFSRPLGHVIYCIGLTSDFRTRPFATVQAHVAVLSDVLQRADFASLLYLSSTRVYGGLERGDEETSLQVRSQDSSDLYNLSKLMGESLCLHGGRANVRIARLSNVLGVAADSGNFVDALVREARTARIVLCSDPASAKDYIRVDDVVNLLPRIALEGREQVYNVASGMQITHQQWVERLSALTGCGVSIKPDAPLFRFPRISIERIQRDFGFTPRQPLELLPDLLSNTIAGIK